MALATQLIRAAPKLSVSGLHKVVDAWKDEQVSNLGSGMQTLALVPRDIETQLQVSFPAARPRGAKHRNTERVAASGCTPANSGGVRRARRVVGCPRLRGREHRPGAHARITSRKGRPPLRLWRKAW